MEQIGRYHVLKRLGEGGFGEVFLGEDAQMDRLVAIKVFHPKDENLIAFATSSDEEGLRVLRERFVHEARILAGLESSPHIVKVFDFGELEDGAPYYVMAYAPRSLTDAIGRDVFDAAALQELAEAERPRALDYGTALEIFGQTLEGMAAAHAHGLVHRDIKPSNILLTDTDQVRVADFGIAKAPDGQHSTVSHLGLGSRNYMAPEQRESAKHVDARADVYALGVLAYRLLTGRLPTGRYADPDVHQPQLAAGLNQLILDCLQENRDDRPADAGVVLARYLTARNEAPQGSDENATGTNVTLAGGASPAVRSELAPLVKRIEAVLLEHGEVPEQSLDTLTALAAVQDLDDQGLQALIDQISEAQQERIRPVQRFLGLLRRQVGEQGGVLPAPVQKALQEAGSNIGWTRQQVEAAIAREVNAQPASSRSRKATTHPAVLPPKNDAQQKRPKEPAAKPAAPDRSGLALAAGAVSIVVVVSLLFRVLGSTSLLDELNERPPSPQVAESAADADATGTQRSTQASERTPSDAQDRERREHEESREAAEIAELLTAARADIEVNRLTNPAGNNAFERVQRILALEPAHREAERLLDRIVTRYAMLLDNAIADEDLDRAATMLARAEAVQPDSGQLADMREALAAGRELLVLEPGRVFRDRLRGGGEGPEMVVIPAGEFRMGSPSPEEGRENSEGPQRTVRIDQPFALGRTPVTFAEYDRFAEATGRARPLDMGWGRGERPVINVSWHEAMAYVEWLSGETDKRYRLPSEAEWEYAARGGTTTSRWWGDASSCAHANHAECEGRTVPVGRYGPNPFGLYDLLGNVWQWTEDCWSGNYRGASRDSSAWIRGDCDRRVGRGGSWLNVPLRARSGARIWFTAAARSDIRGFRVAQDL